MLAYPNTSSAQKTASVVTIISLVVNTVLFVYKYYASYVTGSIALRADAWHTLSDSLTSIVVLFGIRFSAKPADSDHPYGHGRMEIIGSLMVGVLLGFVSFEFLKQSIQNLRMGQTVNFGTIGLVSVLISIVVKEVLARIAIWYGRTLGLKSLTADGWHHRSDAASSVIILAGIALSSYIPRIDAILGLLVALFIAQVTVKIIKEGISALLGERHDSSLERKIHHCIHQITEEDLQPHHFHLHQYGNHRELSFHIRMKADTALEEAHQTATRIEELVLRETGITATIHIEPT